MTGVPRGHRPSYVSVPTGAFMITIEDDIHCERDRDFDSFESAIAELRRRAAVPWDEPPNRAPCKSWATCGREYHVLEYDTSQKPWKVLRDALVLVVSANGPQWTDGFEQEWARQGACGGPRELTPGPDPIPGGPDHSSPSFRHLIGDTIRQALQRSDAMTRSIFDPTGGETERSGSTHLGPHAGNISHMPPAVTDGEVPAGEEVADVDRADETPQTLATDSAEAARRLGEMTNSAPAAVDVIDEMPPPADA